MEVSAIQYPDKKNILQLLLIFCIVDKIHGLTCYQCSWSDSAPNYKEFVKDKKPKDLKFPIIEPFIGGVLDHPPKREDLEAHCLKTPCKHESQVCLIWSFVSDTPKNVTYMCVGNPNRRKGCFQQEIKADDVKQYLKVEACLCDDKDLCNRAPTTNNSCILLLLNALLLAYFLVFSR